MFLPQRGSPDGDSGTQETEDERRERQERRVTGDSKATDQNSPGLKALQFVKFLNSVYNDIP